MLACPQLHLRDLCRHLQPNQRQGVQTIRARWACRNLVDKARRQAPVIQVEHPTMA